MNDCCVSNLITLEMDNYSVNPFLYWRKLFNCMKSQAEASFTGNLQFHLLCVLLEETIFDWLYFLLAFTNLLKININNYSNTYHDLKTFPFLPRLTWQPLQWSSEQSRWWSSGGPTTHSHFPQPTYKERNTETINQTSPSLNLDTFVCDKSFQLRNEEGKTKWESLAGVTDRSAKQPLLKHLYWMCLCGVYVPLYI